MVSELREKIADVLELESNCGDVYELADRVLALLQAAGPVMPEVIAEQKECDQ